MEVNITKSKLTCVEYPAVVENDEKMLETLGGESSLGAVFNDRIKRLELRWRPEDKFCKPACGDRFSSHKLLLRVKRKKKSETNETQSQSGNGDDDHPASVESDEIDAEIVGVAETTYRFECLTDYQYLAMKKKESGEYESFYDDVVPDKKVMSCKEWIDRDVPLFLPSPLYARMDRPQDYSYKDRPKERTGRGLHIKSQPDCAIIVDRAQRKHYSLFHSFAKPDVPDSPHKEALERMKKRPSYRFDKTKLETLKQLFAERPLWTRTALECCSDSTKDQLKFMLPLVAYYWVTGPWRTMWCRLAYDPRKDPESKIYQLVDFRVRGAKFERINVKRSSTKEFQLPNTVIRSGTHFEAVTMKSQHLSGKKESDESLKKNSDKEILWKFRRDVLPTQRQTFYQLSDIDVEEVQQLVHSNDGQEAECTEKNGWLVEGYADKVRAILTSIVEAQIEKMFPEYKQKAALAIESKWAREHKDKGKTGPKHKPKSSQVSRLNQSQTSSASEEEEPEEDGASCNESDLGEFDSAEFETERNLRTETLMEATDLDNVEGESFVLEENTGDESGMEVDLSMSTTMETDSQKADGTKSTGER